MQYIKFQKPYVAMGHLDSFVDNSQLDRDERNRLSKNSTNDIREGSGDTPKWIRDKPLRLIKTLYRVYDDASDVPPKLYVVEHNGVRFVIGSKGNREEPEFVYLVPEELFEM